VQENGEDRSTDPLAENNHNHNGCTNGKIESSIVVMEIAGEIRNNGIKKISRLI